jgi:CRP-like cAMP-binding protein
MSLQHPEPHGKDPKVVAAYLEEGIVPHIYRGLTEMVREAQLPDDPYTWMGEWILKTNPVKSGVWIDQMVLEIESGGYFGEIALLTNKPRQTTVKAVGEVSVLHIDRDAFNRLCGSMVELLSRNMSKYEEMLKAEAAGAQQNESAAAARQAEAEKRLEDDLAADAKANKEDADSLPALPTGPRVKKKAQKRHRGSVFTATVTAEAGWKPPVVPKSEVEKARLAVLMTDSAFLSMLDMEQQQMCIDAYQKDTFATGTNIIRQGDEGDFFYMLDKGMADVFISKPEWPEPKKVKTLVEGAAFGELALLHDDKRAATITATSECTVWKFGRDTFKKIMQVTGSKKLNANEAFLQKVPILSTLTNYERFRLAESMKPSTYNDGDVIIKEGEPGDEFYLVEKGKVQCFKRVLKIA